MSKSGKETKDKISPFSTFISGEAPPGDLKVLRLYLILCLLNIGYLI